ncbi:MAG: hypothetical protein ACPGRW_06080 [Flavobacteriaceae bacterium]
MKKYILILLVLSSCRTAKKEWVKENFSEKATVKKYFTAQDSTFKSELNEINETLTATFNERFNSTTTTKNESTTVSGTITAEDGKEKTATIGNTTITSNGANISFTTSSSKTMESKYVKLVQELQSEKQFSQKIQSELISLKSEFANFVSTYESEKTTKSKTVKKTGVQFGVWIIIAIVLILIVVIWYFRKSIPFIK